jgi:hypothetical protein
MGMAASEQARYGSFEFIDNYLKTENYVKHDNYIPSAQS